MNDYTNGVNTNFNDEDLDGIDDIIEETNGIINVDDMDDSEEEYVPVSTGVTADESETRSFEDIINDEMSYIAKRDPEVFESTKATILDEIDSYIDNLIKRQGFDVDEANAAASKRIEKRSREENEKYKINNPDTVNIRIKKTEADKLVIDPEDESKVHRATAIRLIEVEDKELSHIKTRRRDSKTPVNIMQINTCTLNKYTVPCINTVDMCTFAGSTSYNLVSNIFNNDDNSYDRYSKQIAFVYDRFISSTTKNKYGALGNTVMTLEDFANWFSFPDLQAALYAIYVASSTEMLTSRITCMDPDCKDINEKETDPKKRVSSHTYDYTYNCKELMDFSKISDNFKRVKEDIEKFASDRDGMEKLRDENATADRYKSAMTLNIYEVQVPSCARALEFQKFVNDNDDDHMSESFANIAMFIHAAYIFTGEYDEDGSPIYYEPITDPKEIYDMVASVTEPEFQFFYKKLLPNRSYIYSFTLNTKCDKCGRTNEAAVDVPTLVFLKAQGTEAVIE